MLHAMAAKLNISITEMIQKYVDPLTALVETPGVGKPNLKVNALYRKHRTLVHTLFQWYAQAPREARMSSKRGEGSSFFSKEKQDDFLRADRFQLFCMECGVARRVSNLDSAEVFRRVSNAIAYGDIPEFGSIHGGIPYAGFQHCLTLLSEEVAKAQHEPLQDTLEGRVVYLLELLACSEQLAVIEKAIMKPLQNSIKTVLADGVKRRALTEAASKQAVVKAKQKWSPSTSTKQVRKSAVAALDQSAKKVMLNPEDKVPGIAQEQQLFDQALQELHGLRSDCATKGNLEAAMEYTEAIARLKLDTVQAHSQMVESSFQNEEAQMQATWEDQRSELQAIWSGRDAKLKDTIASEISSLQLAQLQERTHTHQEHIQKSSGAFSIKAAGISPEEWGAVRAKKLRPSPLLLELDERFIKAMSSHRYGLAAEFKAHYEAQAVKEWQEQTGQQDVDWERRSLQLEATHKQQMEALWMRHRAANGELASKAEKELELCDRHWSRKIQRLQERVHIAQKW
eukprot:TRINITY_DN11261_c0_g1_i6.p1 TRINITY_DN11261_c0_g1~~TRINITY_DN11261_c0_g1_i6.p1  ORF type:complete len:512 (+),score=164.16 TRINITY_DN11261_c0_g1_i6:241-1776(+)